MTIPFAFGPSGGVDFGDLPRTQLADVQVFNTPSTVTNLQWMTWRKPRGRSMLYVFCVGGGGGGGGGFTGAASAARGGGGGGGGSATARLMIPLMLLPDVLYVQVGAGGVGVGSGGGVAPSGVASYVSVYPDTTILNRIISSCSAAGEPTGGGTGTGAAVGAAGAGGVASAITNANQGGVGLAAWAVGGGGAAGGAVAGAVGTSLGFPSASQLLCEGGCGGAGTTSADFAGGSYTAVASTYLSEQRPAGPAAGSFDGAGGPQIWQPFFSFGGCGGSSSNAGVGGNGGNGAIGGGGGGGGGGTTGGRGGDGGSGIVVAVAW